MDSQTIINILVGISLLFLPLIIFIWRIKKQQKREREDTRSPFYWIKLLEATELVTTDKIKGLKTEADELVRILTSIVKTAQMK